MLSVEYIFLYFVLFPQNKHVTHPTLSSSVNNGDYESGPTGQVEQNPKTIKANKQNKHSNLFRGLGEKPNGLDISCRINWAKFQGFSITLHVI